jgi:hypothetical protein
MLGIMSIKNSIFFFLSRVLDLIIQVKEGHEDFHVT